MTLCPTSAYNTRLPSLNIHANPKQKELTHPLQRVTALEAMPYDLVTNKHFPWAATQLAKEQTRFGSIAGKVRLK